MENQNESDHFRSFVSNEMKLFFSVRVLCILGVVRVRIPGWVQFKWRCKLAAGMATAVKELVVNVLKDECPLRH